MQQDRGNATSTGKRLLKRSAQVEVFSEDEALTL
jgi:hypothetical protein